MLIRNSPLPRNQSAGRGEETPRRTVHQRPPKKSAPSKTPDVHARTNISGSFIAVLLFIAHGLFLLSHPIPRIHTTERQADDHQRQCPCMLARMMLVQPEAECGAEQRRNDHRPSDQSHHAETEPYPRVRFARLELTRRLRPDLPGEGRSVIQGIL